MSKDDFTQFLDRVKDDIAEFPMDVANIIAETATEYFKGSFRRKAFDGAGWKRTDKGTGSTLVSSGNLMNSIRPSEVTPERVVISAGNEQVPYARIHNEGGEITVPKTKAMTKFFWAMYYRAGKQGVEAERWKAAALHKGDVTIRIPQRQFMGDSQELFKLLETRINAYIDYQNKHRK